MLNSLYATVAMQPLRPPIGGSAAPLAGDVMSTEFRMRSSLTRPFVFSIQGAHAIGKSTLLRQLAAADPDIHVSHETVADLEDKKAADRLDMTLLHDFCTNQRRFIQWEIQRYGSYRPGEVVVVDRGPDSTEFFTLKFAEIMGLPWDAGTVLAGELRGLRACLADRLLYLCAPEDVIRERAAHDDRVRPTLDRWLGRFEPSARKWFGLKPQCVFLNTSAIGPADVRDWTLDWMRRELCAEIASVHGQDGHELL